MRSVRRHRGAGDKFFIGGFFGIDNLTDVKYVGSAWLNPDVVNGKPVFIEPGPPSNVVAGLTLGRQF